MERHFLTEEEVRQLYELAVEESVGFWGHREGGFVSSQEFSPALFGEDWLKFGFFSDDVHVIAGLRQTIAGWSQFEVTSSAPNNLEISRKGVSKASALAEIVQNLGIHRSEVMAIGDSLNDLEMIKWAGLGIAMGNAEIAVKEAADEITLTNEEDGVATAIREFLL